MDSGRLRGVEAILEVSREVPAWVVVHQKEFVLAAFSQHGDSRAQAASIFILRREGDLNPVTRLLY